MTNQRYEILKSIEFGQDETHVFAEIDGIKIAWCSKKMFLQLHAPATKEEVSNMSRPAVPMLGLNKWDERKHEKG